MEMGRAGKAFPPIVKSNSVNSRPNRIPTTQAAKVVKLYREAFDTNTE